MKPTFTTTAFVVIALLFQVFFSASDGYSATFTLSQDLGGPFADHQTSDVPFSDSLPGNGVQDGITYEGQADSSLNFTSLHSQISFFVSDGDGVTAQNGPNGTTQLIMSDTIIATGGSGPGTLQATLSVVGTASADGIIYAAGGYAQDDLGNVINVGNSALTIPFTFGAPVSLYYSLNTYVFLQRLFLGSDLNHVGGVADFTASLGAFDVFDQNMQRVPGAVVQSITGFDYPVNVPEPSSVVLAALGSLGLAAWGLRSR